MSEWNGRLIADMATSHIENTMRLLKSKASKYCANVKGTDWKLYADTVYFDLKTELEKRESALNAFGTDKTN